MVNCIMWLTNDGYKTELWIGPRPEFRDGKWGGAGVLMGVVPRRMKIDIRAGDSPLRCTLVDGIVKPNPKGA